MPRASVGGIMGRVQGALKGVGSLGMQGPHIAPIENAELPENSIHIPEKPACLSCDELGGPGAY